MKTGTVVVVAWALAAAPDCSHPTDPTPLPGAACLTGTEPLFDRYEGGSPDSCRSDADCRVSGCNSEVCAAGNIGTTCEVVPTPRGNFGCTGCACVRGTCLWVR